MHERGAAPPRRAAVAPIDRRTQGLLPWIGVTAAAKQIEALGNAVEDLLRRERLAACGRELDRKRQAIEPVADRGRRRVLDLDLWRDGARTLPEELHRRRFGKRRQWILAFDRDPHRLATRDEEPKAGAFAHEFPKANGRVHDLLKVVQEQEALPVVDVPGDIAVGPDRVRNRGKDESRVAEGRQRDEPDTVGESGRRLAGDRERESRLADTARPGDRHGP